MTGLIVDLIGFLTGTVLYAMLVVMVWREHSKSGSPFPAARGLLPLATGCCGLVWNIGALVAFGPRVAGATAPSAGLVAIAFSALGYLPAVVVHALVEGRETAVRRSFVRPAILGAYALSTVTAAMHIASAVKGLPVPSRGALWLSTAGFGALAAALLFATRQQPVGRRGVWVTALSIFAVSALHFVGHSDSESWSVELLGHHASLPLALAILHQDYRFAFADLFLKKAIALLMLMAVSLGVFSMGVIPLLRWHDAAGQIDARALAIVVGLWMATALLYPTARGLADRFVDRVVLRRPDFTDAMTRLLQALADAATEEQALAEASVAASRALDGIAARIVFDQAFDASTRLVGVGPDGPSAGPRGPVTVSMRIPTVDPPHATIVCGPLAAGRRLLSDEERFLEGVARTAGRRVDGLRVEHERSQRDLSEQRMQRLASEAELRALRARMNPHFLFNALTTIGYLIQQAPPRALETLMRLTSVLRGVLRRSTVEFCSLADEIELVSAYLEIEHARFEERLQVTIDVPSTIRNVRMPTLLLQPLVENAVKHGLAPWRAGGTVSITARLDDGMLTVVVEDSGIGFSPGASIGDGVGLQSVAERLRGHYGDRGSCDIQSRAGSGTRITLRFPAVVHVPLAQERAV